MENVPTVEQLVGKGYGQFWNDKHFYRVVKRISWEQEVQDHSTQLYFTHHAVLLG